MTFIQKGFCAVVHLQRHKFLPVLFWQSLHPVIINAVPLKNTLHCRHIHIIHM
jgi:hypothetical protein